jgi:hypothetical protein
MVIPPTIRLIFFIPEIPPKKAHWNAKSKTTNKIRRKKGWRILSLEKKTKWEAKQRLVTPVDATMPAAKNSRQFHIVRQFVYLAILTALEINCIALRCCNEIIIIM